MYFVVLLLRTRTPKPRKQHCSQAGSTQMSEKIGHLPHSFGAFVLRSPIVRYLQGADG